MTPDRKRIALLLGRDGAPVEAAVRRMARSHEFDVERFESGEPLLAAEPFDLLIADTDVPGRWTGIELLRGLRELELDTRVVLIGREPDFEACRRALRLAATDFLTAPVVLPELFAAIERALAPEPAPRSADRLSRTYTANAGAVECAARDLLAFLIQHGVGPSHRLRIASAVAEIVDNACRHAYHGGGSGLVRLRAALADERVDLDVEDGGRGFDAGSLEADEGTDAVASAARALGSGLVRARRLSDAMRVDSGTGGTRVHLGFGLHPLAFDEDADRLAEVDYLVPDEARRLLRELARDLTDAPCPRPTHDDPVEVPLALLPTVGRLLTAFDLDPLALTVSRS